MSLLEIACGVPSFGLPRTVCENLHTKETVASKGGSILTVSAGLETCADNKFTSVFHFISLDVDLFCCI